MAETSNLANFVPRYWAWWVQNLDNFQWNIMLTLGWKYKPTSSYTDHGVTSGTTIFRPSFHWHTLLDTLLAHAADKRLSADLFKGRQMTAQREPSVEYDYLNITSSSDWIHELSYLWLLAKFNFKLCLAELSSNSARSTNQALKCSLN